MDRSRLPSARGDGSLGKRELNRIQTWYTIRDAGLRLFMQKGYDNVTSEDIAHAADVSRATFFNYFSSKEAVFRDYAPGERQAWQHLFERPATEPLWDSLVAILIGFAQHQSDQLVAKKWLALRSPELARRFDTTDQVYEDIAAFVQGRSPKGNELEGELFLNVAWVTGETAYRRWEPTVPFVDFLDIALRCFERVALGLGSDVG